MLKAKVMQKLGGKVALVPEESPVEDHKANGVIEQHIKMIEKEVRVIKGFTESMIKQRIPLTHPVLIHLPEHAASMITRFAVGPDGKESW